MKETISKHLQDIQLFTLLLFPLSLFLGNGVIEVTICLIGGLFIIISILEKNFSFYKQSFFLIMAVFWGYITIRSLFAENALESLGRSAAFIRFPIFTLAIQSLLLAKPQALKKFIFALIIILTFTSVNLIIQYLLGFNIFGIPPLINGYYLRLTTLHGKIIPGIVTATIALPAVFFSVNELLNKVISLRLKIGYAFFIIVTFLGVLLSGERIALLIIITGYLVIFGVIAAKNIRFSAIALSLLIITILGFTLTFPQLFSRQIKYTCHDIVNFNASAYFNAYHLGYQVAKENILFGVGTKNFYHVCSTIAPQYYATATSCTTHPHNIYLEILAENGIIGLSIFLAFLGNLLSRILHNTRQLMNQPIMFGAVVTLLIKFLPIVSSSSFYVAWSTASLWLMMGIIITCTNHKKL